MKWTIGRKLMAGFMGLVVLLVIVSIAGYVSLNLMSKKMELLTNAAAVRHENDKMLLYLVSQQDAQTDFALTRNEEAKKEAEKFNGQVHKQEELLKKLIADREPLQAIEAMGKMHDQLLPAGTEMAALFHKGKNSEGLDSMKKFDHHVDGINNNMGKLEVYVEKQMEEASKGALELQKSDICDHFYCLSSFRHSRDNDGDSSVPLYFPTGYADRSHRRTHGRRRPVG